MREESYSECYCCGHNFPDLDLIWDEGDEQWCMGCIDIWERTFQEDWATGKPLSPATTCIDCGQKGHHNTNCPSES